MNQENKARAEWKWFCCFCFFTLHNLGHRHWPDNGNHSLFVKAKQWCKMIPFNQIQLTERRWSALSYINQSQLAQHFFPLSDYSSQSIFISIRRARIVIVVKIRAFHADIFEVIQLSSMVSFQCSCLDRLISMMNFLRINVLWLFHCIWVVLEVLTFLVVVFVQIRSSEFNSSAHLQKRT